MEKLSIEELAKKQEGYFIESIEVIRDDEGKILESIIIELNNGTSITVYSGYEKIHVNFSVREDFDF